MSDNLREYLFQAFFWDYGVPNFYAIREYVVSWILGGSR